MTTRYVALDTETTGKSDDGTPGDHRIIEIGCVEIIDRRITNRFFHVRLNPDREVDEDATRVHGMTYAMLRGEPHFSDVAPALIDFIRGSELLIHNARFDVGFLNMEFARCGVPETTEQIARVTDTVDLARRLLPGHQYNLDNLCNHFSINNKHRTLHGALLDAQLLAEVYLALTGGQVGFDISEEKLSGNVRRWRRTSSQPLPIMSVERNRHAMHVMKLISLAQSVRFSEKDGVTMGGSAWGSEFDMPYLAKGEDESKSDYKKRLKEQADAMKKRLLSEEELQAYEEMREKEQSDYEHWVNRVLGRA